MLEGLAEEAVVIGHESHQLTSMDIVEWSIIEPLVLVVVDFEGAIRRNPELSVQRLCHGIIGVKVSR